MTRERFLALSEAWGADLRRWPESERDAARAWAGAEPAAARELLAEADAVDGLLAASRAAVPTAALRDRVIASAGRTGLKARRAGRLWLDRLVWAFGAGWAAAACAGVVAGVMLTAHVTADAQTDAVLYQASLMGVDDTEVLG